MTAVRCHSIAWISSLCLALTLVLNLAVPAVTRAEQTVNPAASATSTDNVVRMIFTTQIVDREPANDLSSIPNSQSPVQFFSELRNLEGRIITHRWEYQGNVMAEIKFQVGGPRWRVYSSKNLLPEWTGQWTVVITDDSGAVFGSSSFEYTATP